MDGIQTGGDLKHRYSQSESEMSTFFTRLSGNVPSFDKMFFNIQYSRGSIKDNSYDPVTKDGYGVLFMRMVRYHHQKFLIYKVVNIMTLAGHQNGYI
ncbi:MAG: hypothetical protein Ct9H300mP18_07950 [Candidatus Neomarinimicrobiota bacterium]|nr:MAG: hypothetical protein Ct9H300mP18_07950 [Candidatus Neomarinimicrobiota bacterium]